MSYRYCGKNTACALCKGLRLMQQEYDTVTSGAGSGHGRGNLVEPADLEIRTNHYAGYAMKITFV